ncbi:MAG: single-stranded DNA-binding protein [Magnetococcales bacterium]|nr:single-stranded DNA-binding protein [Magnetococcales bacterium]
MSNSQPEEIGIAPISGINEAVLDGVLVEKPQFRSTPQGRSVVTLILGHRSEVSDLKPISRLEVQMSVVALGSLANACRDIKVGTPLRVRGRLNQKRWIRQGVTRWGQTELVAQSLEPLNDSTDN